MVSLRKHQLRVWKHLDRWHFTCSAARWPHSGAGCSTPGAAGDMARLHLSREHRERRAEVRKVREAQQA